MFLRLKLLGVGSFDVARPASSGPKWTERLLFLQGPSTWHRHRTDDMPAAGPTVRYLMVGSMRPIPSQIIPCTAPTAALRKGTCIHPVSPNTIFTRVDIIFCQSHPSPNNHRSPVWQPCSRMHRSCLAREHPPEHPPRVIARVIIPLDGQQLIPLARPVASCDSIRRNAQPVSLPFTTTQPWPPQVVPSMSS
jgi:hypothetical protein